MAAPETGQLPEFLLPLAANPAPQVQPVFSMVRPSRRPTTIYMYMVPLSAPAIFRFFCPYASATCVPKYLFAECLCTGSNFNFKKFLTAPL